LDKLIKAFKRVWLFKERIVLLILLGVLGYNVYRIFVPVIEEPIVPVVAGNVPVAPLPEPNLSDAPGQFTSFVRRNPFSYYSDAESDPRGGLTGEEAGIELLAIREGIGGKWRARLKTKAAKWYDEGDSFEEFRLEEINHVEQKVVVFAERFAKSVVLNVKE